MTHQTYKDIVTPELASGAILNEEFQGFKEDYLVLHCLLRKYQLKRFCEIGTNMGVGTKIIKNALGSKSEVFSIDLPTELAHVSLQSPLSEGKGDKVGSLCNLPYHQIRADSTLYDYREIYPLDGFYIDGDHTFINVYMESEQAYKSGARIIIYHDSDIKEVMEGITAAKIMYGEGYELYRVTDTRIAYAIRGNNHNIQPAS